MKSIKESLEWRYATKKFDATKKISDEDLNELLESLRLTPSSFGLEPWKFIVVTDKELREKLKAASWNQSQVTDASHHIVLCVRKNIDEAYVDRFIARIAKTRGKSVEDLKGYKDMMWRSISKMDQKSIEEWNKKQAFIALGFLMSACATKGIDSCPMEGFDAKTYDELLGLAGGEYTTAVLCPVGYRAEDDPYIAKKKVRFAMDEVVEFKN